MPSPEQLLSLPKTLSKEKDRNFQCLKKGGRRVMFLDTSCSPYYSVGRNSTDCGSNMATDIA